MEHCPSFFLDELLGKQLTGLWSVITRDSALCVMQPPPPPQQPQPPMVQQMPQQPPPNVPPPTQYGPDEVTLIYERIVRDLEQHLQVISIMPNNPMTVQLHSLLDTAIQTRNSRDSRAANILLQKVGREGGRGASLVLEVQWERGRVGWE